MMAEEYDLAVDAAMQVVANLNEKAGVRIAPQKPIIDEDRVRGIVDKVSDAENFDDVKWMLNDPVQNFAVHCVDQTVEQNALFQHRAGLRPRIKRDSGGKCCDWCAALDGMYEYPGVPRDIFMRHENCNCTMEFLPGDGSAQDVYSKEWRDLDAIEERKAFSERALDSDEANDRVLRVERLGKYSPVGSSAEPLSRRYVSNDPVFYNNLENTKPVPGYEDFAIHGDMQNVEYLSNNGTKVNLSAKDFADILRADPEYHGGAIRLLSCNTGQKKVDLLTNLHKNLELT
ncbi:MAG: hypothetical protein IKF90_07260 [Parasporobacterium sp.]|nr:hypothetical protein [Parasporobacterium sp.]